MKMLRFFVTLLVLPFMCVSCEDEPAPEAPNKLVGTRWMLSAKNQQQIDYYRAFDYIEFYDNNWCICFKDCDELGDRHLLANYSYDETTNKIFVNSIGEGVLNIDTKECVFDLSFQNSDMPELQSLTFVQEVNYVAPSANNNLAHTKWAATYYTQNDYYLGFLDNNRLVFKLPSELVTYTQYSVHNYTYKDGAITIDGISTYKVDGNKIKIGDYTFKKQ